MKKTAWWLVPLSMMGWFVWIFPCCHPSPSPIGGSVPDAMATACVQACASLAAAQCAFGTATTCPAFLTAMTSAGELANPTKGNFPITCADIAAVRSSADAKALGFGCLDSGVPVE